MDKSFFSLVHKEDDGENSCPQLHPSDDQEKEASDDPIEETLCQQRFVSAEQMTNFSNLTHDMLVEIGKRVKRLEDFTRFRSVSKSLRATVKDEYFEGLRLRQGTPYLMLPVREDGTKDDVRDFYSLIEGESVVASLKVPALKKITMCCESLGWLLAVQDDGIMSMSLVDPFSNTDDIPVADIIESYFYLTTDPERMFIEKMVLSSRPNETSDFILMVICGRFQNLAYWRPGDEVWNWVDGVSMHHFSDVVYAGNEQFYAISFSGTAIWAINLAAGNLECRRLIITELCYSEFSLWRAVHNQYIVKTNGGSLLRIRRTKELTYYLTSKFEVSEIDTEKGTLKKIDSLGSMSLILGRNSSTAVDASKFPRGVIKANHIYFTDDYQDIQDLYFTGGDWREFCDHSPVAKAGGVDSGVYNMETGDIKPIYPVVPLLSNVCPAMFITHF